MYTTNIIQKEIPITTEDGFSSVITIFTDDSHDQSTPVFICLPAMGAPARFYRPLVKCLVKTGYNAVTSDLRGNEKHSVRPSRKMNFGYHEMITYDWPAIIKKTQEQFPGNPLYLLGHSMGGQLSALYLSINTVPVKGLITIACPSLYFRKFGRGIKAPLAMLFGSQISYLTALALGYFPGKKIGVGGIEARNVVKDWSFEALTGCFNITNNKYNFEKHLRDIRCPVLAISLDGDPLAPLSAIKYFHRKLKNARVTYLHLTAEDFGLKKHNHFNWIRRSQVIAREVKNWLENSEGLSPSF